MTVGVAAAKNRPSLFRRAALNRRSLKWKSRWEDMLSPSCENPRKQERNRLLKPGVIKSPLHSQMGLRNWTTPMASIWVDFNNCDREGRVRPNTSGAIRSINESQVALQNGLEVELI